jgi:predicted TIM-barrel fold metal-dependent hydrolase
MRTIFNRRETLALLSAALPISTRAAVSDSIIEPHIHLFSADMKRFPGHPNGPRPGPAPLEDYVAFAKSARITNAVHVSAEPYQDDTRYLEYTLTAAPKGFLKGVVLFDSIASETPRRLTEISAKHLGKIVALRIHCTRGRNEPPSTSGPIRDRDLMHPQARTVWKTAGDNKIAIQAHIMPWFAPQIGQLAREFPNTRVLIDHFGHAGVGSATRGPKGWEWRKVEYGYSHPSEFEQIVELARLPNITLKVSSLQYSSRQPAPHKDVAPLVRRAYDAFGPERLMWGSLGHSEGELKSKEIVFEENLGFLSARERSLVRHENARRFFDFALPQNAVP